jgi:hypothetical protein
MMHRQMPDVSVVGVIAHHRRHPPPDAAQHRQDKFDRAPVDPRMIWAVIYWH